MIHRSKYFYGNKISDYGLENGYVDYRTLAKAFDSIMNNDIMQNTEGIGSWDPYCGSDIYYEDIDGSRLSESEQDDLVDELNEKYLEAEDEKTREEIQQRIDYLSDIHYAETFQTFIVSDNGADILRDAGEIVYYNEILDMYVWCVTHWGTSWDCVLTDIKIELEESKRTDSPNIHSGSVSAAILAGTQTEQNHA